MWERTAGLKASCHLAHIVMCDGMSDLHQPFEESMLRAGVCLPTDGRDRAIFIFHLNAHLLAERAEYAKQLEDRLVTATGHNAY